MPRVFPKALRCQKPGSECWLAGTATSGGYNHLWVADRQAGGTPKVAIQLSIKERQICPHSRRAKRAELARFPIGGKAKRLAISLRKADDI